MANLVIFNSRRNKEEKTRNKRCLSIEELKDWNFGSIKITLGILMGIIFPYKFIFSYNFSWEKAQTCFQNLSLIKKV